MISIRSSLLAAGLAAGTLLLAGGAVAAQTCLGLPSLDGQIAVSVTYAPVDAGTELGGEFNADVSGPVAFGFGYRRVDGSDRESYLGRVAYDFFLLDPAACAVGGVEYTREPGAGLPERLAVPVGLAFGKALRVAGFSATVYGIPRYAWVREVVSDLPGDRVETSHAFLGEAGLTVGWRPFHVGGALLASSLSGDEPSFRIRAGVQF